MQRRATIAVALSLGLSVEAAAQTRSSMSAPGPDTPRLLVAVFNSNDRVTGVQMADALRSRVTSSVSIRTLYVIPKEQIVSFLESSGYRADSSLGAADLKELGKQLRADELVLGMVVRNGTSLKVDARLTLAADPSIAQPLPTLTVASPNDAARQLERAIQDARKQIPDTKACQNFIRSREHAKAIAAANAAIVKYPNATMARLCLANVFIDMKASPDSTLRAVNEVLRIDSLSLMAHSFAYRAYNEKGDGANAVRSLMAMQKLDPGNQTLTAQIVDALGRMGQPKTALPIVDTLLLQNPGDPALLRQRWLLTTAAAAQSDTGPERRRLFAEAVTAGENVVRGDTILADSTYYARQIGSAQAADNPAKAAEFATRATQKFPRNVSFWTIRANMERRSGQLDQALQSMRQAMTIDPKVENGNVFIATIYIDQKKPDSAVAVARRAVAAGEDGRTWGTFLLQPTRDAMSDAQQKEKLFPDSAVVYWERMLALAQEAHRLAPQATSNFFVGVASFQIGVNALSRASEASKAKRPDNALLCTLGKRAQDMFLLTQTHMPPGGSVEPNVARQLLGYVSQTSSSVDDMVRQACNPRTKSGSTKSAGKSGSR